MLVIVACIYFKGVTFVKCSDAISVGAVSLNKVSLSGAEVKVESHCGVLCLSFRKGDCIEVIQIFNGIACQAFFFFSLKFESYFFISKPSYLHPFDMKYL